MRASLNTAGDQEMSGRKGPGKEDVTIRAGRRSLFIGVLIVISTKWQINASIYTSSTQTHQTSFSSNTEIETPTA